MTKEKSTVPRLRFPGFTDAWKQRKLGEFMKESKILGSKGDIARKLTVRLWGRGVVSKKEIYSGSSATQYYIRKSGQFIYGKLDFLNQAFGIIPPELDGYESTLDSPAFDLLKGINGQFLLEFVSRKEFYYYQGNIANGSRKAKRIHTETFLGMPISLPTLPEQEAIGSFFSDLDQLITLHQRKLDDVKELKKALLQKMFPKGNGNDFPELRFPEFTDAWKQRKAMEIFKFVSDKGYADLPILSASQELGMIRRDEIGIDIKYDKEAVANYKRVLPGQFVIHLRSFQGGFAWSEIEGLTSPAYTILDFKEENSSKFWRNVLTSPNFIKKLETVTYGIRDGRSISYSDFSTLNFVIPTLPEQSAIGSFFSDLDQLITLHQRQLDHLKLLKKALLQQMFI
ncbi:restriction endonuclease subunit S [Streptococcus suis]|uniref:restriction endonuclease subunit S n=2 Tax=Streptococcus suis TaxID=1307 RepID=UPI0004073B4A|nr:restriction endonuclease subunit S [Streptococcus suis]MBM6390301.1 restriction endonuclease subunit S [Streptococcus suis]MCB2886561.1 restriction endonuclease subunit S [Streptococcus suis]MCB2896145.1 restriction endonuclease subunit S [Streptococcus suis]MCB2898106.1 restriction endonuclease subunit S [Streptococcus suis]MCB2948337.1 restriction endonuclease subunit S [Streptococcus suis]